MKEIVGMKHNKWMTFTVTSMANLVVLFSINSLNFALPTMTTIPMFVKYIIEEKEYATGTTLITLAMSLVTLPIVTYVVM